MMRIGRTGESQTWIVFCRPQSFLGPLVVCDIGSVDQEFVSHVAH
jgi:hypothetical protein